MLTGESVVCVSSIDWDFNWQGHQEIMARLAAQRNRVLFIENTGVRPPTFRDLSRLRHRIRSWRRGARGLREEQDDLCVYSAVIIPSPYSRVARRINRAIVLRAVRGWLRAVGGSRPILWTFLPTPLVHDLIRELQPELTVYYCVDDLRSSSPPARRLGASEDALLEMADLVFVTAEKLRARAARVRNQVHLFPFGVAYEPFARIRSGLGKPPAELRAVPRPIVGYVGGLNHKLDQELLADVARRLADLSFVLLGPVETDVSTLARCPNIRLLGARRHADLPSYIKEFAVGIVPYRLTEYTAHIYPNKLNEYLAMGLPIVSTDLPEIRRFNALNGNLIEIARDAAGFGEAIQMAVKEAPDARIEQRIQAARRNSWDSRVAEMSMLVEQELTRRRAGTATGIGGCPATRGPA